MNSENNKKHNDDDLIVVSGISGRFPNANNIHEFEHNLYNKIDMTDEDESRWKHFDPEVPSRTGKIRNLNKFDASFFSILNKHANWMDPQCRCLLEHSYEAILDAGISPQSLIGSRTGVFIGCCFSDSRDVFYYNVPAKEGYGVLGNASFYLSNRLSYALGLCGPSFTLDSACSSSSYALDCAYKYMMSGACDAAIVGGSQLVLNLKTTTEYNRLRILAPEGEFCRPFDEKATGFTRADAISCVFLQRKKDSRRVYAQLVYTNSNNDGFKKEGSTFPSRAMQIKLMKDFFGDSKIDPGLIDYVEAHSTGTRLGDPQEIAAIDDVFCKSINRKRPLAVGSVKSNIGHAEASSGIASVAKILLGLEKQKIAPNINITKIRDDIPAFAEGRIRVVTEVEDLTSPYVSMNSFGLGGANTHALFKGNLKQKINHGIPSDNLERIVMWSGRTEEAVNVIFDDITKRPLDAEYIGLLQNSQIQTNPANIYRGYAMFHHDIQSQKAVCISKEIQHFNGEKRPIVFVYSGIGSQWSEMGVDLMNIPIFADTINYCHNLLVPKGIDLKHIISSPDKSLFNQVLNSYVGIISIEIALTNILNELGIKPDYIIGHSVGEMGCAYGDGCWSAEETILAAYSRGIASNEIKCIPGAMAAIGLNYRDVSKSLPSSIDIACHNGIDSTTVSGPVDDVREYVKELKEKNIFAREIESSGLALHSRYIKEMGINLLQKLENIIKNPKKRSEKWLSSSYPESEWNLDDSIESQYSSAEYHTKNLLNPVLFEEVTEMLPKNALTIEIGPHGLLKSILKRSLNEGIHLNLTQRNRKDGSHLLMDTLGKLFLSGIDINIQKLYPTIEYPVSRGTPMISPKLKWNHAENYFVGYFDAFNIYERRNVVINLNDKIFEFIQGHIIDGKVLFPGTGWVYLVWETFARMNSVKFTNIPVVFEDIKFMRATSLAKNQDIVVTINIHRGSGRFEIIEGKSVIANGYIKHADSIKMTQIDVEEKDDAVILKESDFYKEMRLRGYYHKGLFRAITEIRDDGLKGKIKWNSDWVTFMDCFIQFQVLMKDTRMLILPTSIRKIIIDPVMHLKLVEKCKNEEILFDLKSCPYMRVIQAGGIEIHGFEGSFVNRRRPPSDPVLESYEFIPYRNNFKISRRNAAKVFIQIALENAPTKKFTSIEIGDENQPISEYVFKGLGDLPLITPEVNYITADDIELENILVTNQELSAFTNVNIIIKSNCANDASFIDTAKSVLLESGFIISKNSKKISTSINRMLEIITEMEVDDGYIYVMQFKKSQADQSDTAIQITSNVNDWLEPLKEALCNGSVLVYSQKDDTSGIIGLVNCIRKEPNGNKLRCVLIDDETAPIFNVNDSFYRTQLDLGLAMNVYKNNKWGSYRHLKLTDDEVLKPRTEHCYANCLIKGDLSTLSWLYGPLNVQKNKDVINIFCSSLNFRDVMIATGKLTSDDVLDRIQQQCVFGFEFSGTMKDGRKVMGLGPTGAMATKYDASRVLLWDVPNNWTLEDAATVPLVYYTVYLAFFKTIQIEKEKSILIHAGSGGIGLAAIQVAIAYGLNVYTTVGSDEKRDYLLSKFPTLKKENIGNSRNTTFERMICVQTKGKGVDYVLNSLSADMLQASIRCLGMNGTFLEIGKFDIMNKTKIDMGHFTKRVNFKAVFFDDLPVESVELKIIHDLVEKDIKSGIVQPLKVNLFKASEIEQAFRFMGSGKHIGKVILKMREHPNDVTSIPIKTLPRIYCNPEESYIIVGGLGGFGLELADWLVLRGCRNLVMSSGRGITNAYQAARIKIWKSYGVDVKVTTVDVTTRQGCEELLTDATRISPVGGIFNLAVALRDGIFENQTTQMFNESLAPKAIATKYLDEYSRKQCPSLKYFVIFSSVSCGRGNAGQSNYGMGNSIMERICENRHKLGLPAKAIQWGAIGDVGLLANLQENNMDMEISGTLPQRLNSCLEVLDLLLTSSDPVVASMIVAEKQFEDIKKGNIVEAIMNIMAIRDRKQLSMESSFSKLGMDSLMSVEIQQILERDYDILLSSQELRSITLGQLEKRVNAKDSSDATSSGHFIGGIEMLLNNFGDEKKSNETILKVNDLETGDTKVLIFTGIEGCNSDALTSLARNLKNPAYVLQFGKHVDAKTLDDVFDCVSKDVLDLFSGDEKFLLLGYSFGSLLALKFVDFLESNGKIGNIVVIDGSPKFLNEVCKQLLPSDSSDDDILRFAIISCIKLLFAESVSEITKKVFLSNLSMQECFEKFLELAAQRSVYSIEYGRRMIIGLINKIKIGLVANSLSYPVLKQSFELIKASESSSKFDEDYGMAKYTKGHIKISTIKGDHLSILNTQEMYTILNDNY